MLPDAPCALLEAIPNTYYLPRICTACNQRGVRISFSACTLECKRLRGKGETSTLVLVQVPTQVCGQTCIKRALNTSVQHAAQLAPPASPHQIMCTTQSLAVAARATIGLERGLDRPISCGAHGHHQRYAGSKHD
eukprot:1139057-Pelagomonas_calceolata.AAC.4